METSALDVWANISVFDAIHANKGCLSVIRPTCCRKPIPMSQYHRLKKKRGKSCEDASRK